MQDPRHYVIGEWLGTPTTNAIPVKKGPSRPGTIIASQMTQPSSSAFWLIIRACTVVVGPCRRVPSSAVLSVLLKH